MPDRIDTGQQALQQTDVSARQQDRSIIGKALSGDTRAIAETAQALSDLTGLGNQLVSRKYVDEKSDENVEDVLTRVRALEKERADNVEGFRQKLAAGQVDFGAGGVVREEAKRLYAKGRAKAISAAWAVELAENKHAYLFLGRDEISRKFDEFFAGRAKKEGLGDILADTSFREGFLPEQVKAKDAAMRLHLAYTIDEDAKMLSAQYSQSTTGALENNYVPPPKKDGDEADARSSVLEGATHEASVRQIALGLEETADSMHAMGIPDQRLKIMDVTFQEIDEALAKGDYNRALAYVDGLGATKIGTRALDNTKTLSLDKTSTISDDIAKKRAEILAYQKEKLSVDNKSNTRNAVAAIGRAELTLRQAWASDDIDYAAKYKITAELLAQAAHAADGDPNVDLKEVNSALNRLRATAEAEQRLDDKVTADIDDLQGRGGSVDDKGYGHNFSSGADLAHVEELRSKVGRGVATGRDIEVALDLGLISTQQAREFRDTNRLAQDTNIADFSEEWRAGISNVQRNHSFRFKEGDYLSRILNIPDIDQEEAVSVQARYAGVLRDMDQRFNRIAGQLERGEIDKREARGLIRDATSDLNEFFANLVAPAQPEPQPAAPAPAPAPAAQAPAQTVSEFVDDSLKSEADYRASADFGTPTEFVGSSLDPERTNAVLANRQRLMASATKTGTGPSLGEQAAALPEGSPVRRGVFQMSTPKLAEINAADWFSVDRFSTRFVGSRIPRDPDSASPLDSFIPRSTVVQAILDYEAGTPEPLTADERFNYYYDLTELGVDPQTARELVDGHTGE